MTLHQNKTTVPASINFSLKMTIHNSSSSTPSLELEIALEIRVNSAELSDGDTQKWQPKIRDFEKAHSN